MFTIDYTDVGISRPFQSMNWITSLLNNTIIIRFTSSKRKWSPWQNYYWIQFRFLSCRVDWWVNGNHGLGHCLHYDLSIHLKDSNLEFIRILLFFGAHLLPVNLFFFFFLPTAPTSATLIINWYYVENSFSGMNHHIQSISIRYSDAYSVWHVFRRVVVS